MTYNDLECQFYVKIRFRQQGCRALTFALARLSCLQRDARGAVRYC